MSSSCNDYIIKDGKFVRDFEGMYKNIEDPWNQSSTIEEDLHNNSLFFFLDQVVKKEKNQINSILDVGCAQGVYAQTLIEITQNSNCRYLGVDISPTVIKSAKAQQNISFEVDDIRQLNKTYINQFDIIFSSKTLYYVAPEIDAVLENIESYIKNRGLFAFGYNQRPDSFTNQWLNYNLLREKILRRNFKEKIFVELSDGSNEMFALGIFEKESKR